MPTTRLFAAMVSLVVVLPGAADDLTQLRAVRQICASLISSAGPSSHDEAAAFIVERGGHVFPVMWKRSGSLDSAQWDGPIPLGTVAIFHTHPGWLPVPSSVDGETAMRTRLPVYVVTPNRIMKTLGQRIEVVALRWN